MNQRVRKILENIPNDNEEKIHYVERMKKYNNECGCFWGANLFCFKTSALNPL